MIDQLINYNYFVKQLPEPALSENSLTVLTKRYLRRNEKNECIETPKELFARVAWHIAGPEEAYGGMVARLDFANRVYTAISTGRFMFNTPTLFNAGTGNGLGLAACFVRVPEDSLKDIAQVCMDLMQIQKSGGGVGYDFSLLRPKGSLVKSCSATTDGPLPFIDLYCAATNAIQQGAKRRGAQMGLLDIMHPDIWDFIQAKSDMTRWQNMNVSPKITDKFMQEVLDTPYKPHEVYHEKWGKGWLKKTPDGVVAHKGGPDLNGENMLTVGELFHEICKRAWTTGEPGLAFWDTIQKDWKFKASGANKIAGLNPCFPCTESLLTTSGYKTIKELLSGDAFIDIAQDTRVSYIGPEIDNNDPKYWLVDTDEEASYEINTASKPFLTKKNTPIVKVKTKAGLDWRCTPDHHVATYRGMIEAKDLIEGDKVLVAHTPINNIATRVDSADYKVGLLCGFIVGDGFITDGELHIQLDGDKKEHLGRLCEILEDFYNKNSDLTYWSDLNKTRKCEPYVIHNVDERNRKLVSGVFLTRFLKKYDCFNEDKYKLSNGGWCRSQWFAGFLSGLFLTDGHVDYNATSRSLSLRISSTHPTMLKDLQKEILTYGIFVKRYLRREECDKMMPDGKGGQKLYHCQPNYELIVQGKSRDDFFSLLQPTGVKAEKYWAIRNTLVRPAGVNKWFTTIVSVEPDGNEDVYCLKEDKRRTLIVGGTVQRRCSEQSLENGGVCTLASINLSKYYDPKFTDGINWTNLQRDVMLMQHSLDNVVEVNEFPVDIITKQNKKTRRIGGGIMGWADLLFQLNIPYESEKARNLAETIMNKIAQWSWQKSEELARQRGSFLDHSLSDYTVPMRNAYRNTAAPTGTISIISDCSSGIEPIYSLAFTREVMQDADGKRTIMREVNPFFKRAIERFLDGYDDDMFFGSRTDAVNQIIDHVASNGSIQDYVDFFTDSGGWDKILDIYQTAKDVSMEGHVLMQASWQKYIDTGISKTININNDSTVEDVKKAYILAWQQKCKGVTVYRDGCRDGVAGMAQPMKLDKKVSTKEIYHSLEKAMDDHYAAGDPQTQYLLKDNVKEVVRLDIPEGAKLSDYTIAANLGSNFTFRHIDQEPYVTVDRNGKLDVRPDLIDQLVDKVATKMPQFSTPSDQEPGAFDDISWTMPQASPIKPLEAPFNALEVSEALKVKQITPMGNLHVITVLSGQKPVEIFAQISKAGEQPAADLEAICRMTSLYLRSEGSFDEAIKQLEHIGSSNLMPSKDGQIKSLPDGLALALKKIRKELKARVEPAKMAGREAKIKSAIEADDGFVSVGGLAVDLGLYPSKLDIKEQVATIPVKLNTKPVTKVDSQYRLTCPATGCGAKLVLQEGCHKCSDPKCGYSKC